MAQVTAPVILDSTGQQIVTALNNLSNNVKPTADQIKRTSSNNQTVEAALVSLNSQKVAYALGNDTIANIQSALVTLAGTMADGEIKRVRCNISSASGIFRVTAYIGELMRISSSRLCVNFRESMYANDSVIGNYKDGTWYWSQLQTKIYVLDFYNTATGAYQTDISAGNVIGCHVMNWGSDIVAAIHVGTNDKALIHVYSASTGAAVTNTSVRLRLFYV